MFKYVANKFEWIYTMSGIIRETDCKSAWNGSSTPVNMLQNIHSKHGRFKPKAMMIENNRTILLLMTQMHAVNYSLSPEGKPISAGDVTPKTAIFPSQTCHWY